MLIRALVAVFIAAPALAQVETAHQLHLNGIDGFAFDPPYLHPLHIDGPESVATLPDLAARPPHNHLTLVNPSALHAVINRPDPGFIGLEASQQESGLALTGGLPVDHLLKDLSGDGAPEAVIWQPGSGTIHIAAGRSAERGDFGETARRVEIDLPGSVFGADTSAVEQVLDPASRMADRLFVRVGAIPTGADAKLTVQLSGAGLAGDASIDHGEIGVLREVSFEVSRGGQAGVGAPLDLLSLSGQNVAVSWVSVRSDKPFLDEETGTAYEVVTAPAGLDWEAARAMAQRRRFDGRAGELADHSQVDPDRLAEVLVEMNITGSVWLGAVGETGAPGSMQWLSGAQVAAQIDPDLENGADKTTLLLAHPDGTLSSSGRRTTAQANPIAALVAYPK